MLFRIAPDPIHLHRRSSIFPGDRNSAKIASAFSQGAKDRPPTKIHTAVRVNPLADFIVLSRTRCRIIHLQGCARVNIFPSYRKHKTSAWRVLVTSVTVLTGILLLTRFAYTCNAWPLQITLAARARTRRKIAIVTRTYCALKCTETFLTDKTKYTNDRYNRFLFVPAKLFETNPIFIMKLCHAK